MIAAPHVYVSHVKLEGRGAFGDVSTCDTLPQVLTCDTLPRAGRNSEGFGAFTSDSLPSIGGAYTCDSLPSLDGCLSHIDEEVFGSDTDECEVSSLDADLRARPAPGRAEVDKADLSSPAAAKSCAGGLKKALSQCGLPDATVEEARSELPIFCGRVRQIRFVGADADFVAVRFVHEAILNKLPYFEARMARWDEGDAGDVRLPDGVCAVAIDALLQRLYATEARWTLARWAKALGPGLQPACGALTLAKFLLADDVARELVPLLRQRTTDVESRALLRETEGARDVPELADSLQKDPDRFAEAVSGVALMDAAASLLGQSEGDPCAQSARLLFAELLRRRSGAKSAARRVDVQALLLTLLNCPAYIKQTAQLNVSEAHMWRPGLFVNVPPAQVQPAFVTVLRIPVDGFVWLWQFIQAHLRQDPALCEDALYVFQALRWIERFGGQVPAQSVPVLEEASCQALRAAFASFVLLLVQLLSQGSVDSGALLGAIAIAVGDAQAPPRLDQQAGGQPLAPCHNALHLLPCGGPCSGSSGPASDYVGGIDLLSCVLAGVDAGVRAKVLELVPHFRDWQWAFSAASVRSLSEAQQLACVRACSPQWLSAEVCGALRGEALQAAQVLFASKIEHVFLNPLSLIFEQP